MTLRRSIPAVVFFLFASGAHPGDAGRGSISAIAVSPNGVIVAGGATGVFRSADGGVTWKHVINPREGFQTASIAFDPGSSDVFVSTTVGLFRSADGGSSWSEEDLMGGVMPGKLVFDPEKTSTLYVASADGLYVTTDRGAKWKAINPNGRHFAIRSLSFREKPFTLYVVNEEGAFASTDRGASWNAQIDERDDLTAIAFQTPATLHLAANGSHYLRSSDGGTTWEPAVREWPHFSDFFTIGRDVFASTADAIWRSTDGGRTWSEWNRGTAAGLLLADPRRPRVIWSGSPGGGIATSTDGGKSWKHLRLSAAANARLEPPQASE